MADGLLNKASIILTPTGYKAGTLYNVAPVVEPYEDFDFARASVASRVNSSGLVEMVGRTLGSDLNDLTWSAFGGWSILDGVATNDGSGSTITNEILEIGKTYKITVQLSTYTSGNFSVFLGSGTESSQFNGTDEFTFYGVCSGDAYARVKSYSGIGSVNLQNISVKEVIDTNNIPRISYDSNGDNGHILLEPTSTNLITYSEDFTQGWSDFNVGFTSGFNSPDGTNNATLLSGNGISSFPNIKDTLSSSGDVSFSVFVKKELSDTIALRVEGTGIGVGLGTNSIYTYTFSTNSFSNVSGEDASGFDSESFSNDWIRLQINYTSTTITACRIYPAYNVANSEGVYIWGAQLEALSYASSYIPTLTGSTETRATETATGAGSATLINSTEGVLYLDIAMLSEDDKASNNQIFLSNNSSNNRVGIFIDADGDIRGQIRDNEETITSRNVTILDQSASGVDTAAFNKIAILYKSGQNKVFVNGSRIVDNDFDSFVFNYSFKELNFDNGSGTANFFRGKCKALAVFNEALSDDELNNLTG